MYSLENIVIPSNGSNYLFKKIIVMRSNVSPKDFGPNQINIFLVGGQLIR